MVTLGSLLDGGWSSETPSHNQKLGTVDLQQKVSYIFLQQKGIRAEGPGPGSEKAKGDRNWGL